VGRLFQIVTFIAMALLQKCFALTFTKSMIIIFSWPRDFFHCLFFVFAVLLLLMPWFDRGECISATLLWKLEQRCCGN